MKIVQSEMNLTIQLQENIVSVLSIECADTLMKFTTDIWGQWQGETGQIVWSHDGKELSFEKDAELIFNPFSLEINSKKILTRLYQEMKEISNDQYYEIYMNNNTVIIEYLDKVCESLPYGIVYDLNPEIVGLFKLYDVRLDVSCDSIFQNILNYMQISQQLCNKRLFVFLNIKSFLTTEQVKELYKTAFYIKVYILLIETKDIPRFSEESVIIIDKDNCIIYE